MRYITTETTGDPKREYSVEATQRGYIATVRAKHGQDAAGVLIAELLVRCGHGHCLADAAGYAACRAFLVSLGSAE